MKNTQEFADLQTNLTTLYQSAGLLLANFTPEQESAEYSACAFTLNTHNILFRTAKITPTKIGQFVTIWKRIGTGPIMPFDNADKINFIIIQVTWQQQTGHFIFPKSVLVKQDYISQNGIGGKRAMRVYPPWDTADSKQAVKTQTWQLNYFCDIAPHFDKEKLQQIVSL